MLADSPPILVHLPYPVGLRRHRCYADCRRPARELEACATRSISSSFTVGTPVLAAADGVVAAAVGGFPRLRHAGRDARARQLRRAAPRRRPLLALLPPGEPGRALRRARGRAARSPPAAHDVHAPGRAAADVADRLPTAMPRIQRARTQRRPRDDARRRASWRTPASQAPNGRRRAAAPRLPAGGLHWPAARGADGARRPLGRPAECGGGSAAGAAETRGRILFVDRCADVDFYDKGLRAEASGMPSVLAVNFDGGRLRRSTRWHTRSGCAARPARGRCASRR